MVQIRMNMMRMTSIFAAGAAFGLGRTVSVAVHAEPTTSPLGGADSTALGPDAPTAPGTANATAAANSASFTRTAPTIARSPY